MNKIIFLVVLVGMLWLGLRVLEQHTLYFPDRTMIATPKMYRLDFEDLTLTAADGIKIHGWFVPAASERPVTQFGGDSVNRKETPINDAPAHRVTSPLTLLFCHGNAGNISHRLDKANLYHKIGLGSLLFDYRGYGLSEGKPSETGTYKDAEAAYEFLTQTKGIPANQIVLYGESLGCAVATELAIRHPEAAALILESPFTSTVAMAKRVFPWLPARWIVRYHYDNLDKIAHMQLPLLILHSPQDEIIPFEMARQLYSAARGHKRFFELTGGHNTGFLETGPKYSREIHEFLEQH